MNTLTLDKTRVFKCSSCGEYINTSMSACKFCGNQVNLETAEQAADVQDAIGNACSEANYLKVTARAIPVAYAVSFIPLIGGAVGWGFLILLIVTPSMFLRWWIKYPTIQTSDGDYKAAKTSTWISIAIWGGMILVWLVASLIISLLLGQPQ